MKKFIGFLPLIAVVLMLSCSSKPAEVKKEIIVVPATQPVIIVKDPPAKSTTVTLDKNGVKVETKKVNVSLKNNQ
jgi:hypothetical protein